MLFRSPRYHLHIGDVGQSNALKIARRLDLPEHLITRAQKYLDQTQGSTVPEWDLIARMRREAEEARQEAIAAQADAERARDVLNERLQSLQMEAQREETLAEARARLQPGDRVIVPRMGYDRPGRIVKIDPRKKTATVAIGHMTWNVAVDELLPQDSASPATVGKGSRARGPSLEDFEG